MGERERGTPIRSQRASLLRLPAPVQLPALMLAIVAVWSPYLWHWRVGLNSDSAVPVLMARKILDGDRPLYFWGQDYFGAIDSYLAAGVLALFGRDHVFVSYLPQLLAYALGAALLVRTAPAAERLPRAFLLVMAPPALFLAIARCGLSQDPLLWLGFVGVIALRPALDEEPRSNAAFGRAVAAGLALALAAYRIPTSLIALPVLIGLTLLCAFVDFRADPRLARARSQARALQLLAVIALAQLARLPELFGTVPADMQVSLSLIRAGQRARGLATAFLQFDPLGSFGVATSGHYTFYSGLPVAEYRERFSSASATSTFSWAIAGTWIALIAAGIALVLRSAWHAVRAARMPDFSALYFAAIAIAVCAGAVLQTRFTDIGSARHLLAAFVPMVVCMATALARLPRRVQLALALLWSALVVVGHGRMLAREDRVLADLERANRYVLSRGVEAGFADYWLGYLNVVLSDERLVLAQEKLARNRYLPYAHHVYRQRKLAALEFCPYGSRNDRPRLTRVPHRVIERRAFGPVCVTLLERTDRPHELSYSPPP